jgi:exopolyphosphatase/guanosine-5'-triphosphate,3'-diphosphate pyrophosphatase
MVSPSSLRVAVIDLGANAVRFDVHRLTPEGSQRLHRERLAIRLGEGVFESRRLSSAAKVRALAAFQGFAGTCRELRVDKVTAVGTSALRTASDGMEFVARLKKETGITVRVITGAEEARLIAQAIVRGEEELKGLNALVDVGGGSSEITLVRGRRAGWSRSFDLGAIRLQERLAKGDSPKDLRDHIRHWLEDAGPRGGWPRVKRLIGSGGTVRALLRLHQAREGDAEFTPRKLNRLVEEMAGLSLPRLLRLPGMDPKRADILLAGGIVLGGIAAALRAGKITATELGLREGILWEERVLFTRTGR